MIGPKDPLRGEAATISAPSSLGRAETASIARFIYCVRQNQNARGDCIHREDLLDFETHGVAAFARHRCEPRSVDLDFASPFRSDRSGSPQIAHQERHRRSSHTQYLRKRLLGEREDVLVDPVAKMEQPACHAGLDRMQRIAGPADLKLYQHRLEVNLDCVADRGAPAESGVESQCGDARGGARRTNDGGHGRRGRPQHGKSANCSLAPDCSGGDRLPVRRVDHHRNGAAMREEDVLGLVTRPREDRVPIERDHL
jgi:hypothetical protein